MKQPSFFIVGAPKCGTTALCKYLNRHPDIFIPSQKELNYFDQDLNHKRQAHNLDEYLKLFEEGKDKICGEGSPSYLKSLAAVKGIYEFNPEAKIIIMIREPVALLYSMHSQLLFNGSSEDITDFQKALEAEEERRQGKRIPQYCPDPQVLFYSEYVKFSEQIQRYYDTFGRDNVLVIIYDDFSQKLAEVYANTLAFLGVDASYQLEDTRVINANKKVRNRFVQQLIKYPPKKVLEIGKFFIPLPPEKRRALLESWKKKIKQLNTEEAPRQPLDPELKKVLQAKLAPEVEKVSKLLGRDLSHWSKS